MVGDPTSTAGWWAPTYITPCTSSPAPTDYITCLFQQRRLPPSSAWQITSLWYVWPRPPPPAPPTASLPSCSVPAPHACMDGCAWDGLMMTSLVSPHPPCARCGWTPGCAESSLADVPGRVHYFRQCDLHVSARSGPAGGCHYRPSTRECMRSQDLQGGGRVEAFWSWACHACIKEQHWVF